MDAIQKTLLMHVAEIDGFPVGAYNIRANGMAAGRASTENIEIIPKADKDGIDIVIKPQTKGETVYIPVVLSQMGHQEMVYNDFYIGEGADVTIIAGCGIHAHGEGQSRHDGVHSFFLAKDAKVRYIEKHYGEGDDTASRVMNPHTVIEMAQGSYMEMETTQIKGVDSTMRKTEAIVGEQATLIIHEKLMTHGTQVATADFTVTLAGEDAHANIISRSVAKDQSQQEFISHIYGNAKCYGHSECDAILMDQAVVSAIPEVKANHLDASLIHEAAIGKIAGEQLVKLMTLGLSEEEAEEQIVNGFLK